MKYILDIFDQKTRLKYILNIFDQKKRLKYIRNIFHQKKGHNIFKYIDDIFFLEYFTKTIYILNIFQNIFQMLTEYIYILIYSYIGNIFIIYF